jgi:hypothetical protein
MTSSGLLTSIGEGSVDVRALGVLERDEVVTVCLLDAHGDPAGRVNLGAVLLGRAVRNRVTSRYGGCQRLRQVQGVAPARMALLSLDGISEEAEESTGLLTVRRVVCSITRTRSGKSGAGAGDVYMGDDDDDDVGFGIAHSAPSVYQFEVQVGRHSKRTGLVQGQHRICSTAASSSSSSSSSSSAYVSTQYSWAVLAVAEESLCFEGDYQQLPQEYLQVDVFRCPTGDSGEEGAYEAQEAQRQEMPGGTEKAGEAQRQVFVGRGKARLTSLMGRLDGLLENGVEFALQLRDQDAAVGTATLALHLSTVGELLRDLEGGGAGPKPPTGAAGAAGAGGLLMSPTRYLRSTGATPRLHNVPLPAHSCWLHIDCITASNLNRFKLVGSSARARRTSTGSGPNSPAPNPPLKSALKSALRSPLGSPLAGSSLLRSEAVSETQTQTQDPYVVLEVGGFWSSHSAVLLNQVGV